MPRRNCCSARTRPTTSGCSVRRTLRRTSRTGSTTIVVGGATDAVNPARTGTKVAAQHVLDMPAGDSASIRVRLTASGASADGRAGQGKAAGRAVRSRVQSAAQGGRPVLRDGHPADAATGRGDGDAPSAGRAAVGQAVLRVQRAPLATRARRRPLGPARRSPARCATCRGSTWSRATSSRCRTSGSTRGSPRGTSRFTARRCRSWTSTSPRSRSSCCSTPAICTPTARSRPTSGTSATSTRR